MQSKALQGSPNLLNAVVGGNDVHEEPKLALVDVALCVELELESALLMNPMRFRKSTRVGSLLLRLPPRVCTTFFCKFPPSAQRATEDSNGEKLKTNPRRFKP